MARIRTIKPDFFRHELLQDLEIAHPGMYPMMVFEALWGHCDSKGRFEWKPRTLKLDILPFLPFDMATTLGILEDAGMLHKYAVDGKEYGVIHTFEKHQRLSGKELTEGEKHPAPYVYDTESVCETTGKQSGSVEEIPESQEGKGMEWKGKEKNIPQNSSPPDGDVCVSETVPVPAKQKKETPLGVDDLVAAGVDRQIAADWLVIRKAKRLPLTKTALSDIESSAASVGIDLPEAIRVACCSGWAGFRPAWYRVLLDDKLPLGDDARSDKQRQSDAILAVAGTRNFV